jgi:hypothetical protein
MIPSGCRYLGEPSGGVTHPFSQRGPAAPRVGGGSSGRAGGVGDGVVAGTSPGETGGRVVFVARTSPGSSVHAAARRATASASVAAESLRGCMRTRGRNGMQDIVRGLP